MDEQERWQVDGGGSVAYQRYLVPLVTARWAVVLADRATLRPGERVLDVACGTGVVARIAAQRVGSAGYVTALDINPEMLAVGRSLPPVAGAPIEWREGSALNLPLPDGAFADFVRIQLTATPLTRLFASTPADERARILGEVTADVQAALAPYIDSGGLHFPQVAHHVLAVAG